MPLALVLAVAANVLQLALVLVLLDQRTEWVLLTGGTLP